MPLFAGKTVSKAYVDPPILYGGVALNFLVIGAKLSQKMSVSHPNRVNVS